MPPCSNIVQDPAYGFNDSKGFSIWNYNTGSKKAEKSLPLFNKNLTRDSKTDTSQTKFYGTPTLLSMARLMSWNSLKANDCASPAALAAWIALDCEDCYIALTSAHMMWRQGWGVGVGVGVHTWVARPAGWRRAHAPPHC